MPTDATGGLRMSMPNSIRRASWTTPATLFVDPEGNPVDPNVLFVLPGPGLVQQRRPRHALARSLRRGSGPQGHSTRASRPGPRATNSRRASTSSSTTTSGSTSSARGSAHPLSRQTATRRSSNRLGEASRTYGVCEPRRDGALTYRTSSDIQRPDRQHRACAYRVLGTGVATWMIWWPTVSFTIPPRLSARRT